MYNETILDLLDSGSGATKLHVQASGQGVSVPVQNLKKKKKRESIFNFSQGLTEIEVKTLADVRKVMEKGERNRSTAQTAMNSTRYKKANFLTRIHHWKRSSRSHLILSVSLTGVDAVSKAVTRGKLMLVDLAGSERISRSEAKGQRLVEAAAINKSLTSLGQVYRGLSTLDLRHAIIVGIYRFTYQRSAHSLPKFQIDSLAAASTWRRFQGAAA